MTKNLMVTEVSSGISVVGARELRFVPPSWQHPTDDKGRHVPLFTRDVLADAEEDPEFVVTEADIMPDFGDEATHLALYETCSEGTPVSPAFASREELARYLADNNVSAFADITLTYDEWLAAM